MAPTAKIGVSIFDYTASSHVAAAVKLLGLAP